MLTGRFKFAYPIYFLNNFLISKPNSKFFFIEQHVTHGLSDNKIRIFWILTSAEMRTFRVSIADFSTYTVFTRKWRRQNSSFQYVV